jgi:hypothetical protein
MPCAATACGSAPATSARPPVLTSGTASEATERTCLVDQADAAVGAAEAAGVEFGVFADDQAFGYAHAAIHDHSRKARAPADVAIGQHHRLADAGKAAHLDAGEQQAAPRGRARDDAVVRDERRDRRAAPPVLVVHELRRGGDDRVGPDRPLAVIEVEAGDGIGEVQVRLEIGVERADVAPVFLDLLGRADARGGETVGHRLAVLDDVRDHVPAEVPPRMRIGGVAAQFLEQEIGVEHVDAHGGQREVRVAGNAGRVFRLFDEGGDHVVLVDRHDAEAGGLPSRHDQHAHGHVRARIDVLAQHQLVIHLVDVIARQDHHIARGVRLDDVDVLVDRVGGAFVPQHFVDPLRGGQDVKALVAFGAHEVPGALHVADQRVRLVLRGHADAADARIDCVRQREINDPRLAAEIYRRLGAVVGQFVEAATASSGEHISHRLAGERLSRHVPHPGYSVLAFNPHTPA